MANINKTHRWAELTMLIPIPEHSLYRKIDRILDGRLPGRVLEVGCLDGRFLEHLKARGWDVTGLDLQPQTASYIVEHDAAEPFPFGADFDVVVAAEVIEHVVDTEAFLGHCANVLKPGGTFIVTTPNLLFGVNRLRMLLGRRPAFAYEDFHVRMFVWDDLKQKIEKRFVIDGLQGSHLLVGRHRGAWAEVFAWLGDRLPTFAAHFIVTARKAG